MTDSDDRMLAGEYVLGLLEGVAKLNAERRLASDPAFAREVESWRVRFAAFDDAAAYVRSIAVVMPMLRNIPSRDMLRSRISRTP